MTVGPDSGFNEKMINAGVKSSALRRQGRPEEMAEMALWLASEQSSYATGGHFVVDGGITA
jgi:NAD(P)-dependent dehydrogenase (short-subunit alcohol dehydrogenase family)